MNREVICFDAVAPARERGLKFQYSVTLWLALRRSREGAWIEIYLRGSLGRIKCVAPARERGLKYLLNDFHQLLIRSLPRGSVD